MYLLLGLMRTDDGRHSFAHQIDEAAQLGRIKMRIGIDERNGQRGAMPLRQKVHQTAFCNVVCDHPGRKQRNSKAVQCGLARGIDAVR